MSGSEAETGVESDDVLGGVGGGGDPVGEDEEVGWDFEGGEVFFPGLGPIFLGDGLDFDFARVGLESGGLDGFEAGLDLLAEGFGGGREGWEVSGGMGEVMSEVMVGGWGVVGDGFEEVGDGFFGFRVGGDRDFPERFRGGGGGHLGRGVDGVELGVKELLGAVAGEVEHAVELIGGEGGFFAGALEFDEGALAGEDDVHIDFGADIFLVAEVEDGLAVEDTDADTGDLVEEGGFLDFALGDELLGGQGDGDVGSGDGGGAGSSIGLEDIAIEPDGTGSEFFEAKGGAHGAADEALDFGGAAVEFTAGDIAGFSCEGGVGEHGVFGGDPAAGDALFLHPAGDGFIDTGGADDLGISPLDQGGACGVGGDMVLELEGAEFVGLSVIGS
ncbi:MAG: hypothetical protein RI897_1879 [Verrucomicrobiota bacterium]